MHSYKIRLFPHLNSHHERTALDVDPVFETGRIVADKPGAIIVTAAMNTQQFLGESRNLVRSAIVNDYVLAETTGYYPGMVELYIRADLAPAARPDRAAKRFAPCAIRYGKPRELFAPFSDWCHWFVKQTDSFGSLHRKPAT